LRRSCSTRSAKKAEHVFSLNVSSVVTIYAGTSNASRNLTMCFLLVNQTYTKIGALTQHSKHTLIRRPNSTSPKHCDPFSRARCQAGAAAIVCNRRIERVSRDSAAQKLRTLLGLLPRNRRHRFADARRLEAGEKERGEVSSDRRLEHGETGCCGGSIGKACRSVSRSLV